MVRPRFGLAGRRRQTRQAKLIRLRPATLAALGLAALGLAGWLAGCGADGSFSARPADPDRAASPVPAVAATLGSYDASLPPDAPAASDRASSTAADPTTTAGPTTADRVGQGPGPDYGLPVDPVAAVGDHTTVATALGPAVMAYLQPSTASPVIGTFANPIPSGAPLVFDVVARNESWLQVSLPVRPNGTTGWIPADGVTLARNRYRIEIDATRHHLVVFRSGAVILDTPVGIGTGDTPTPIGVFYLVELLAPPDPAGAYGPYAFGLSGYSETLASFNGGVGVIGIHGTDDPTSVGRDASHGCIRVANDVITDLAGYLPLGTPVVITR